MASPLDISVQEAREIVTRVSRDNGWIEPELAAAADPDVLASIAGLRRQVADTLEIIAEEVGSGRGRFILELTQNVEDCSFDLTNSTPWLNFEVHPERIIVESNQDGFTGNDVSQICHAGRSWKRQQHGYVGEKGIGFKAAFQVASRVHIQSNAFSFYFIYRREGTVEERLGMVTPLLADDLIPRSERPLTRMTLTSYNTRYEDLIAHFDQIHPTLLLFLSKLQKISITIHRQPRGTTVTTFTRTVPLEDPSTSLTLLIKTVEDEFEESDTDPEISRYYIFKHLLTGLTRDADRPEREGCELVLAFQVDESDDPVIPTQYDVFAYLPVGNFGFNFMIQGDFILQASREEVKSDSEWNKNILIAIADSFCNAVLDFCGRDGPLRYRWVEYLPFGRAIETHNFWRALPLEIIDRLKNDNIFYIHETLELRKAEDVRILPSDGYLDDTGSPLFRDRPGTYSTYLSLEYGPENIEILQKLFDIEDIEDLAMCHIIKHDLIRPDSIMKGIGTSDNWHSKAARLILSILERSRGTDIETLILEDLPLIPLSDGRWVTTVEADLYFPAEIGPAIPQDIVVAIDSESIANEDREELFEALGARECEPNLVVNRLWEEYTTRSGAADLPSSISFLRYLYWHAEHAFDPRLSRLWVYDDNGEKINTVTTDVSVYLPSRDEHGPQALFTGALPELSVSFLNPGYLELISPINRHTRRHNMSWLDWLKQALRVRDVPRLSLNRRLLSNEFRYIIQNRPAKIIGILKIHWAAYRQQMSASITEEIKAANVACWNLPPTQLQSTYFPTVDLLRESENLGIILQFPFLDRDTLLGYADSPEDWGFLRTLGVRFEANINFYLEVLRQHKRHPQRAWNLERADILSTYSSISDHYSESNKEIIVEAFRRGNLILHPSCFQAGSTSPRWIDIDRCVWKGPQDLLDRTPLYSVLEYRRNRRIARLFHGEILGIQNADWNDYKRNLIQLKISPNPLWDVADRAERLYKLFFESPISIENWDSIRNTFELDGLIYVPSTNQWYPPSRCLWSSPLPIEGMAVINADYPAELINFFLGTLRISPASLPTLVEALRSLGESRSSVERIKQMIKAINGMSPTRQDLESLTTCNILPIRRHTSRGDTTLGSPQETFAIIDNIILSNIFRDHVDLLDFSLEEMLGLVPFLESLGVENKGLSRLCTADTACDEAGVTDGRLTCEFIDRTHDILRIAVSNRTPRDPRALYDLLLATSILKTDSISTTYTLHHTNGEITGPIHQNTGYVHIRDQAGAWQIFVPRQESNREVCYKFHLPESIAKRLEIPAFCREHISLVLNSSTSAIVELLETAGVGQVPGIEANPRRVAEGSDDEEEGDVAITPQETSIIIADEFSGMSQVSRGSIAVSERGSFQSFNISDPQLFREPEPEPEQEPNNIPNIPIRGIFNNIDAYTQLLGHVIRIARRTSLPQSNFQAAPGNGQYLPGYDHKAAFGFRTLNQMRHDSKIGAAGELFVFEILLNELEPQFGPATWNDPERHFGPANWRSTIRDQVTVHPNYSNLSSWLGREISDIVYADTHSRLTRLLIDLGYLDDIWVNSAPEYLIEVKTTTGNCADRFFMGNNQYRLMQDNALRPGYTSAKIYVVFRVYDLGKETMNVKIYVDPEAHRQRDRLFFAPMTWTVRPGA